MAYNAVPTVSTGDLWTAANHNTYIRDNFAAGVPDIFTTKGDLVVGTGSNAASRLAVGANGTVLEASSTPTEGVRWNAGHGAYATFAGQSIPTNTITKLEPSAEIYDPDGAQTTGSGYKYDAPYAGLYLTNCYYYFDSASWAVSNAINLYIYKGGVQYVTIHKQFIQVTATILASGVGVGWVDAVAGDDLDVRIEHNAGANRTVTGTVQWIMVR